MAGTLVIAPLAVGSALVVVMVAGASIGGLMLEQARARAGAAFGAGSSGPNARVGGLDTTRPAIDGRVQDLPEWTDRPSRPLDTRGVRKGLIYYARIAGATPFPYIDRAIAWNLDQVLGEYPMRINYSFRPTWKQRQLYLAHLLRPNPNGCAPPGTSIHESGFAVDTNMRSLDPQTQMRKVAVFARWGFEWRGSFTATGVTGDPVHFEIRPERAGWRSNPEAVRYNQAVYRELTGDTR